MQEFYIGHRTQILAPEVDEAARNIYSNLSYYDTDRALKELFPPPRTIPANRGQKRMRWKTKKSGKRLRYLANSTKDSGFERPE
jgi:hypothetical protein